MTKQKKRKNERDDGRLCKNITIGRNDDGSLKRKMVYANTKAELDLKIAALLLQKDKGIIIDDKNKTIDIWADEWINTYKSRYRPKTIKTYKSIINKYIKPNFKDVKLRDLKQYQILKVLNEIKYKSVPKRFLSTVTQMLDAAMENDYISKNVAIGLEVKKHSSVSKEPLNNEQIAIIKNTPHEIQNICLFLIYSGLRISELIQLTWSDIDMKNRILKITDEGDKTVKTKASIRKVPIVQPLYDLLKNLDNTDIKNIDKAQDYIFKDNGNMYTLNRLCALRRDHYRKECGFDFTFHQLRHTCASMLYYAGVGIKEAQEWLGHGSSQITMDIYTHLKEKEEIKTTTKIDEYLKTI